jgi:hypothetical protein
MLHEVGILLFYLKAVDLTHLTPCRSCAVESTARSVASHLSDQVQLSCTNTAATASHAFHTQVA